jgi:hypothetical protein
VVRTLELGYRFSHLDNGKSIRLNGEDDSLAVGVQATSNKLKVAGEVYKPRVLAAVKERVEVNQRDNQRVKLPGEWLPVPCLDRGCRGALGSALSVDPRVAGTKPALI